MEFFRQRQEGPDKHFRILDMTFGSGGHTCYILDQFRRCGVQGSIVVYASDCDPESYNLARRIMNERNYGVKELVPIRSTFQNLEEQLQNSPKGYEVLQNIDETSLVKLLRRYGSLKAAKHVATAILEARYMQYEFKTVHELTEIMENAVKHATKTPHSDTADPQLVAEYVMKTIAALRMFVNDELNQLDFAIRYLATKYLKIDGILAVIAHNDAEKKVVHRCLKQISLDDFEDQNEMLSTQVIFGDFWRISYIDPRNINIAKD